MENSLSKRNRSASETSRNVLPNSGMSLAASISSTGSRPSNSTASLVSNRQNGDSDSISVLKRKTENNGDVAKSAKHRANPNRKNSIMDMIINGDVNHIKFLKNSMALYNQTHAGGRGLCIPQKLLDNKEASLKIWLEQLGFSEENYGSDTALILPVSQFEVLDRALKPQTTSVSSTFSFPIFEDREASEGPESPAVETGSSGSSGVGVGVGIGGRTGQVFDVASGSGLASVAATPMSMSHGRRVLDSSKMMSSKSHSRSHRPVGTSSSSHRLHSSSSSSVAATPMGALTAALSGLTSSSNMKSGLKIPSSNMKTSLHSQTALSSSIASAIESGDSSSTVRKHHHHSHHHSHHHHSSSSGTSSKSRHVMHGHISSSSSNSSGNHEVVRNISTDLFNNSNITTARGTADLATPQYRKTAPAVATSFSGMSTIGDTGSVITKTQARAKSPPQLAQSQQTLTTSGGKKQLTVAVPTPLALGSSADEDDEEEMKQFGEYALLSVGSTSSASLGSYNSWRPGSSTGNSISSGSRGNASTPFSPTAELAGGLNKMHMSASFVRSGRDSVGGGGVEPGNLFGQPSAPAPVLSRSLRSNSNAALSVPKPVAVARSQSTTDRAQTQDRAQGQAHAHAHAHAQAQAEAEAHSTEYDSDDTVLASSQEDDAVPASTSAPAPAPVVTKSASVPVTKAAAPVAKRTVLTRMRSGSQVTVLPEFGGGDDASGAIVGVNAGTAGANSLVRPAAVAPKTTRSTRAAAVAAAASIRAAAGSADQRQQEGKKGDSEDKQDSTAGMQTVPGQTQDQGNTSVGSGSGSAMINAAPTSIASQSRRFLAAARQSPLPRSPSLLRPSFSKTALDTLDSGFASASAAAALAEEPIAMSAAPSAMPIPLPLPMRPQSSPAAINSSLSSGLGLGLGLGLGETSPIAKLPSKSAMHSPVDLDGDEDELVHDNRIIADGRNGISDIGGDNLVLVGHNFSRSQTPPNGMGLHFGSVIDDSFVLSSFADHIDNGNIGGLGGGANPRRSSTGSVGSFCIRAGYADSDSSMSMSSNTSMTGDLVNSHEVGTGTGMDTAVVPDENDDDELERTEILEDEEEGEEAVGAGADAGASSSSSSGGVVVGGNALARRSTSLSGRLSTGSNCSSSSSSSGYQLKKSETYRPTSKRGEYLSKKPATAHRSVSCNGTLHSSSVLGGVHGVPSHDIFALARATASSYAATCSNASATPCKTGSSFESTMSKAFSTPIVERSDFLHSEVASAAAIAHLLAKYAHALSAHDNHADTPVMMHLHGMSHAHGSSSHGHGNGHWGGLPRHSGGYPAIDSSVSSLLLGSSSSSSSSSSRRGSSGNGSTGSANAITTIAEEEDFSQSQSPSRRCGNNSQDNSFCTIQPQIGGGAANCPDTDLNSAFSGVIPGQAVAAAAAPVVVVRPMGKSQSTNSFLSPGGSVALSATHRNVNDTGVVTATESNAAAGFCHDGYMETERELLSIAVPEGPFEGVAGEFESERPGSRCRRREEMQSGSRSATGLGMGMGMGLTLNIGSGSQRSRSSTISGTGTGSGHGHGQGECYDRDGQDCGPPFLHAPFSCKSKRSKGQDGSVSRVSPFDREGSESMFGHEIDEMGSPRAPPPVAFAVSGGQPLHYRSMSVPTVPLAEPLRPPGSLGMFGRGGRGGVGSEYLNGTGIGRIGSAPGGGDSSFVAFSPGALVNPQHSIARANSTKLFFQRNQGGEGSASPEPSVAPLESPSLNPNYNPSHIRNHNPSSAFNVDVNGSVLNASTFIDDGSVAMDPSVVAAVTNLDEQQQQQQQSRAKRRLRQSQAKWRRMSMSYQRKEEREDAAATGSVASPVPTADVRSYSTLSPTPGASSSSSGSGSSSSVKSAVGRSLGLSSTPGSMTKMHSFFSFDSGGKSQEGMRAKRKERRSSVIGLRRGSSSRDIRELRRRSSLVGVGIGGTALLGAPVRLGALSEGDMDECDEGADVIPGYIPGYGTSPVLSTVAEMGLLTSESGSGVEIALPIASPIQIALAHYQAPSGVYLDESNWRYHVVGGTYQHCVENCLPVVAPPGAGDSRVLSVRVQPSVTESPLDVSLILRVLDPHRTHQVLRSVVLGSSWVWYRVNPQGFLLAPRDLCPETTGQVYYVPFHPIECLGLGATRACGNLSMALTDAAEDADDDAESMSICESFGELDPTDGGSISSNGTRCLIRKPPTGWLYLQNIVTLTAVLEFLLPADGMTEIAATTGSRTSRRNMNNIANALNRQQLLVEAQSYKCVNRAFAAAVQRNVVFHLSRMGLSNSSSSSDSSSARSKIGNNSNNTAGNTMSVSQFNAFVNRFPTGKYLSEGACKQVYCIIKADTKEKFALSSMDMATLVGQQGVETAAISAELETSLLCSSLLTSTRMCPNFLHVYSLFSCSQPPAEKHWLRSVAQGGSGDNNNSSTTVASRARPGAISGYQYMRMEFCSYGDAEDLVRARQHLSASCVRSALFQMFYATYVAREQLGLRHYDIKLLNFFATSVDDLLTSENTRSNSNSDRDQDVKDVEEVDILYGFCDTVFKIPFTPLRAASASASAGPTKSKIGNDQTRSPSSPSSSGNTNDNFLVKLADFGTSSINRGELNDPISENQFTTLENTPIEYLLLGSMARQTYSADTYQLGLSMFHLCSGEEPYEELVAGLRCPPLLLKRMRSLWEPKATVATKNRKKAAAAADISSSYSIITNVIDSLVCDDDEEEETEKPGDIMYHTLYRYLVMFYSHSQLSQQYLYDLCCVAEDYGGSGSCAAVRVVCDCLGLKCCESRGLGEDCDGGDGDGENEGDDETGGGAACGSSQCEKRLAHAEDCLAAAAAAAHRGAGSRQNKLKQSSCCHQYVVDRHLWSVQFGTHPVMQRVRAKLAELDNPTPANSSSSGGVEPCSTGAAGGAGMRLLLSLLDIDPAMRPTMYEALRSPVFRALHYSSSEVVAPGHNSNSNIGSSSSSNINRRELRYMHYYRAVGSDAEATVPPML